MKTFLKFLTILGLFLIASELTMALYDAADADRLLNFYRTRGQITPDGGCPGMSGGCTLQKTQ